MHDQYAPSDHHHNSGKNHTNKRLWGIIYSNAFFNSDCNYAPALYFVGATFNHSSAPNVGYDFAGTTQRMWTTRAVAKVEELLDCYSDVFYHYPTLTRQVFLWDHYHFDCQCPACWQTLLQDDDDNDRDQCTSEASDERRSRLYVLAKMLAEDMQAAFLYNADFDHQVTSLMETVEEDGGSGRHNTVEDNNVPPPPQKQFLLSKNHLLDVFGVTPRKST